jgi:hypothetical protein
VAACGDALAAYGISLVLMMMQRAGEKKLQCTEKGIGMEYGADVGEGHWLSNPFQTTNKSKLEFNTNKSTLCVFVIYF